MSLYFCIIICPVQLSMFHMERRSRNAIVVVVVVVIIIIIIIIVIIISWM